MDPRDWVGIEVDTREAEPLLGVVHAQRRQQADGSVKHVMFGSHPVIEPI